MTKKKPANRDEAGRFKPGYSGNPNGRPKKEDTIGYWLLKFLKKKEKGHKKPRIQELAEKIAVEAFKGDRSLMKEIFDRTDGKPTQPIETRGEVDVNVLRLEEIIDAMFDVSKKTKRTNKGSD